MEEAATRGTYRSRAVERAFNVLLVLGDRAGGATLAELARETNTPPSTMLGILGSLTACKAVKVGANKRYSLDVGVLQLGQAYSEGVDLTGLFFPIGRRLCASIDETVQLGVLSGSDVVYIARQESTQPVRLVALVGRRLPAHASAIGKTLLAHLDDGELEQLLGKEPLERITSRTLTTYEALHRDLEAIRKHGFGESCEECIPGLHCLSAPVFDHAGAVVAALSVSVPRFRMNRETRRLVIPQVVSAAAELSQALGARPNRLGLVGSGGGRTAEPNASVTHSMREENRAT